MDSKTTPLRPFSFEPNNSTNSMTGRDMDSSMSPTASLPPPRFAANYESKEIPSLPNRSPWRSQIWSDGKKPRGTGNQRNSAYAPQTIRSSSNQQQSTSPRSPAFQPPPSPRSPAYRHQFSSPTPPMTKSSQKILQLTGFDPRFERALPVEHQQLSPARPARPQLPHSPVSSKSSGSFYSQTEVAFQYEQAGSPKNSSTLIAQSSNSEGKFLTSSMYNISDHSSKSSNISRPNIKTKLKNEQRMELPPRSPESAPQFRRQSHDDPLPLPSFPTSVHSMDSTEITTLPEILAQEQMRYDKGAEKDAASSYKHTIPIAPSPILSPLATSSKAPTPKPKHITVTKDKTTSLFRAARDSLEWGIYDPSSTTSSPSKSSTHVVSPVSPMFSMESDHLTLSPPLGSPSSSAPNSSSRSRTTRSKKFGSGSKHPLKSPFPFSPRSGAIAEEDEEADSMPSPSTSRTFKRRVSSTIKHLSPTSPGGKGKERGPPSSKKYVITNAARRADGPATPIPPKNGFMEGVMRGKEVLGKVGKSVVGPSREEKRRESLKKMIVVVGITDQSPGGMAELQNGFDIC